MNIQRAVVTGGAGFIGSHLTERLLRGGFQVTILDNFSSGRPENISTAIQNPSLSIVRRDLKKDWQSQQLFEDCEVIFHLAANPEVRTGETEPKVHFEENVTATFKLLEAVRKTRSPKLVVFASTSTVYGEAEQIPTPEDYAPLIPISTYGASKLACEALITSYAHTFNHRALIIRLANVIGARSNHGVIADFIKKIKADPTQLEILGDGKQEKSYMHVKDCVEAFVHLTKRFRREKKRVDVYNVGTADRITAKEIARIVAATMKHPNITFRFTGGVDGGRGWRGDVKTMQLSTGKLLQTGWKPQYNSRQSVQLAAKELAEAR